MAWCLLAASVLDIKWNQSELGSNERTPNSIIFAILGLMKERGLLSFPLSFWPWRSEFKSTGILGQNWLPFYESVRRGWTTDRAIVGEVTRQPILNDMLSSGVTFLDIDALKASHIDLSKRVFNRRRELPGARSQSGEIDNNFIELGEYE